MPPVMATTAPPRRTQAERRASTRGALLDATLACLIERGYAGTTTAEIERRAGVSRGARLHHFPTKARLMAAGVVRLFDRIGARYADAMARLAPGGERFHEGYRQLFEVYADESYAAVLELFVAARHDGELRAALRETSTDLHREIRRMANAYFPDLAHRDADGLIESLQAVMTGLALQRFVFHRDDGGRRRGEERVLGLVERMVGRTFELPASEGAKETR